jgi:cytochrome P450
MRAPAAAEQFRADDLRLKGLTAILARAFANPSQRLYAFLRNWLPILKLPELRYLTKSLPLPYPRLWALVTRREDVVEVLSRYDVFAVPWVQETIDLNDGPPGERTGPGTNFILGIDGGSEYAWQLAGVMRAFRRADIAESVVPMSRAAAEAIVGGCGGRLDAVADLITAVPLELCERYYGVRIPDRTAFAQWTIALSGYLFGPPYDRVRTQRTTQAAATLARRVIDDAIRREIARAGENPAAPAATVLARLAREHLRDPGRMTALIIRSWMMGVMTGFVPTNTVAAGHILDTLLTRRDFMAQAREAAACGDDDRLARTLFEAMRFRPLNPGPWRRATRDYTIAAGTWRATKIRTGRLVLASTQSAMFDPRGVRNPGCFDPGRDAADSMLFGHGLHWCVGKLIAEAQIAQTLKPLLLRGNLRRARGADGELALLGLFPEHLFVEFDFPAR